MQDKKAIIKQVANDIFRQNGFKATNIALIMEQAQMAVGTFYNYYRSKDELFMELYIEENDKLKRTILSQVDKDQHPMLVMTQMLALNEQEMAKNPILSEWYNKDSFKKIETAFKANGGFEGVDFMYSAFSEIVQYWQEKGVMRQDLPPDMIMAIFNALVQIEASKEQIGLKYFPDIMHLLGEFVMTGLLRHDS